MPLHSVYRAERNSRIVRRNVCLSLADTFNSARAISPESVPLPSPFRSPRTRAIKGATIRLGLLIIHERVFSRPVRFSPVSLSLRKNERKSDFSENTRGIARDVRARAASKHLELIARNQRDRHIPDCSVRSAIIGTFTVREYGTFVFAQVSTGLSAPTYKPTSVGRDRSKFQLESTVDIEDELQDASRNALFLARNYDGNISFQ